jgi:gamma-glutamyltranspeptidase
MVIHLANGSTYALDYRETAPAASNATMFANKTGASVRGGLAVAVPGEVAGYAMAHRCARAPLGSVTATLAESCLL